MFARINPKAWDNISIEPWVTVSSRGKVSSFAKLIPIGMMGTRKTAASIMFSEISFKPPNLKVTIAENSKMAHPKQEIRVINRYFRYALSRMPETIDEHTPPATTQTPSTEISNVVKPNGPKMGSTLMPKAVFIPIIRA